MYERNCRGGGAKRGQAGDLDGRVVAEKGKVGGQAPGQGGGRATLFLSCLLLGFRTFFLAYNTVHYTCSK